jgi:hypothetical protein
MANIAHQAVLDFSAWAASQRDVLWFHRGGSGARGLTLSLQSRAMLAIASVSRLGVRDASLYRYFPARRRIDQPKEKASRWIDSMS